MLCGVVNLCGNLIAQVETMFIDGQWLDSDNTFDVVNPATGEVIGKVVDGDESHATLAIEAAANAFSSWSGFALDSFGRRCCSLGSRCSIAVLFDFLCETKGLLVSSF